MDVPATHILALILLTCLCWPTNISGVQSLPVLNHSLGQSSATYPVNTTAVILGPGYVNVTVIIPINDYHPIICCFLSNRGIHAYNGNAINIHPICQTCGLKVYKNHRQLKCDECQSLLHMNCANMSLQTYKLHKAKPSLEYVCHQCGLPDFSDSMFNVSADSTNSADQSESDSCDEDIHDAQCNSLKAKHRSAAIYIYININSLRYKFTSIQNVVHKLEPACFMIAETKLDDSFQSSQFLLDGYHPPFRKDRNMYGGGLLLYIRSDIPCRRLSIDTNNMESIAVELHINKKPWFVSALYKSPGRVKDIDFTADMETLLDHAFSHYDNIVNLGDLNFDLNVESKSKPLKDIMSLYDLTNMINTTTFTSRHGSSLIDVALTNNASLSLL